MGTLHALLADAAARVPDRAAVIDGGMPLTHGELDRLSRLLRGHIQSVAIGPRMRVALWMDKSALAVIAIVAVLRAGATYVPVDPRTPVARAQHLFADAQPGLVLADTAHADAARALAPDTCLILTMEMLEALTDAGSDVAVPGDAPAFILYTSGSTGAPKGVVIGHAAARCFVDWSIRHFAIRPEDRLASHAPFHFDLSVLDLFGALGAGASVSLVPQSLSLFAAQLAQWIERAEITIWYSVPGALVPMLRLAPPGPRFAAFRLVLLAGERLPPALVRWLREHAPAAEIHNLYGPTETNVVTTYRVPADFADQDVPIGRACDYADCLIVDADLAPVAPGERGELLVSGGTLMLGYWRRPHLNAQALVTLPGRAANYYRTGDQVRMDAGGELCFLGRRDTQVKVRGFRIELEEIEAVLLGDPAVTGAVVVDLADARLGEVLHAVVTGPDPGSIVPATLRQRCAESLPPQMIPVHIKVLATLPETANGKIDRAAVREAIEGRKT